MSAPRIAIATNNGDIGGGEVMLLSIAEALREIGLDVLVVGPTAPGDLVEQARSRGFAVEALPADGRKQWMLALLRWRLAHREMPLWCNGLVPSLATAGIGPRIVHLHQVPEGAHRVALAVARIGARRVLAISEFMGEHVAGSTVLENWTAPIEPVTRRQRTGPVRIGFLGRLTRDKGVHVLAEAVQILRAEGRDVVLVLGGENRHGDAEDDRVIETALAPLGDAVERTGWITRDDFFASVDIAAFPSVWEEHFGLVAAEAMGAQVPFVVSDRGALPDVVGTNYPWIARGGDAYDLARVLAEVIDTPETRIQDVLRYGRDRWESRYSPKAGRTRVATLLGSMLEGHESRQQPSDKARPSSGTTQPDPTNQSSRP